MVAESTSFELDRWCFESQLRHIVAERSWANYISFLSFSFLIRKKKKGGSINKNYAPQVVIVTIK